jgi:transcriptional regulator with XRE-family HTH domain
VKSFGVVCRETRAEAGLTQKDVAEAGDLAQSRVSEIERGRYTPGLDLAARLAKGLGVPLTELVARWEGLTADVSPGGVRRHGVRARQGVTALDVPQEDLFRRIKGLWEDMSPERREQYWKFGRSLLTGQWQEEQELERMPRPHTKALKSQGRPARRGQ